MANYDRGSRARVKHILSLTEKVADKENNPRPTNTTPADDADEISAQNTEADLSARENKPGNTMTMSLIVNTKTMPAISDLNTGVAENSGEHNEDRKENDLRPQHVTSSIPISPAEDAVNLIAQNAEVILSEKINETQPANTMPVIETGGTSPEDDAIMSNNTVSCSNNEAINEPHNEALLFSEDFDSDDSVEDRDYVPSPNLSSVGVIGNSDEEINVVPASPDTGIVRKRKLKNKSSINRQGKKRCTSKNEWRDNVRKANYAAGKSYISKNNGKIMPEKKLKPPCPRTCRSKCSERLFQEHREQIHNFCEQFAKWHLGQYASQPQI